jgi:hypothetical protein
MKPTNTQLVLEIEESDPDIFGKGNMIELGLVAECLSTLLFLVR